MDFNPDNISYYSDDELLYYLQYFDENPNYTFASRIMDAMDARHVNYRYYGEYYQYPRQDPLILIIIVALFITISIIAIKYGRPSFHHRGPKRRYRKQHRY